MRNERQNAESGRLLNVVARGGKCFSPRYRVNASPRRCSSLVPYKAMARSWDPIRDLVTLQDRMNHLFQEAAEKRARGEEKGEQELERVDWIPAADLYETEKEYSIIVDLPGIERDALEISLDDNRLVIRGERALENEGEHRVERPQGRFMRKFGVPATVDQKAITAEYKDGVLRVRLPKRSEQKTRRVEIKVS
jgi:HSP20 family protein